MLFVRVSWFMILFILVHMMGWKLENMWRAESTFAEFLIDYVGDCKDFDSDHINDVVDKEWSIKNLNNLIL